MYYEVCNAKLLLAAARCHVEGIGNEVDLKRAHDYYKVVKNNFFMSDSSPIVKLARCYEQAIGIPKNIMEAIKYYKAYIKYCHSSF